MVFEEFKKQIVEGLQEIYGDSTQIETGVALRNNGSKYNGINIFPKGSGRRTSPVIDLDRLHKSFEDGRMRIGDCVWDIYNSRTVIGSSDEVEQFAENISEWEYVRGDIYPVLLSTEENSELLEKLVSTPMLDLSVVYAIRRKIHGKDTLSVKITKELMLSYEITPEQIHRQAMINMGKDGYEFLDLESLVRRIPTEEAKFEEQDKDDMPEMYILTNSDKSYGAAGILNKKLLRDFAGKRDFIILPSSVHETLFVPVTDGTDQRFFDAMVSEVNRTQVCLEEKLADHSYYYDAAIGEIRMCA